MLLPSPQRALLLDKAYHVLAREQSFTRGRDALAAAKVYHEIAPNPPTSISESLAAPRLGVR